MLYIRKTRQLNVAVHLQPQWPWCLKAAHKGPPFFPTDEVLSVIVAAVMGLQHALAMVGGIVTPPLIIGYLQKDPAVANCKRVTSYVAPRWSSTGFTEQVVCDLQIWWQPL